MITTLYRIVETGKTIRMSPDPVDPSELSSGQTVDCIQQDVPTVLGRVELWSGDDDKRYPHLHYVCPRCATEQNADLRDGDSDPRFACCDSCGWDSVVLITYEKGSMKNTRRIKQQMGGLDQNLAAAEEYVARNVNVRGFPGWLRLSDWKGKSGHPLWMKHHMVPSTLRALAEKERALERIRTKGKEKQLKQRRRSNDEL